MTAIKQPKLDRYSRLFFPKLDNAERGPRYASVASESPVETWHPRSTIELSTPFLRESRNRPVSINARLHKNWNLIPETRIRVRGYRLKARA